MGIRSPFDKLSRNGRKPPAAEIVDYGLGEAYEVVRFVRDHMPLLIQIGGIADEVQRVSDNIENFGDYALIGHLHDDRYSRLGHDHDGRYALFEHFHDEYAIRDHDHDERYQPIGSYAPADHNHDARYVQFADKGVANGVASLDPQGKIPTSQIPKLAISKVTVVASQAAQLALEAEEGDTVVRSDLKRNYIHNGGTTGTIGDWTALESGIGNVTSINGQSGVVSLVKGDLGLGNVDNTADATKAVLTAVRLATARTINGVAFDGTGNITISAVDTANPRILVSSIGAMNGVAPLGADGKIAAQYLPAAPTKTSLGLDQVDNTSDANKPVSSAQATAIATRVPNSAVGAASGVAPLGADGKVPGSYLPAAAAQVYAYRVGWFFTTALAASEVIAIHPFTKAATFPANWAGSVAVVDGVAPDTAMVIDVQKNNVSVGTLTIGTNKAATFVGSGPGVITFAVGDRMKLVGPATINAATFVSGTFEGTY